MDRPLHPFAHWHPWRRKDARAQKLYGAIVAQTRLPVFYQAFGVPDSLAGRFVVLSLHLFVVMHRLRQDGVRQAVDLSQQLIDIFSRDMETVLRESGVGDLSVPKKMRGLAGKSLNLLEGYEETLAAGEAAFVSAIAGALPLEGEAAQDTAEKLASYLRLVMNRLEAQRVAIMSSGKVEFPMITAECVELLGDRMHD